MNLKWCISTFLFISLCFGAFQEQKNEPNQEIILEFVDTKTNEKNIENTLIELKEKLLKIGVTNILIQETKKGTLKICYFSNIKAENIKTSLTNENQNPLNQNPEDEKNHSNYSIDIYQLNDKIDSSNLGDNFILEIKYFSDRFTVKNISNLTRISSFKANQHFKTSYKFCKNNPFTKDYTSHKEPEVRAGPQNCYI